MNPWQLPPAPVPPEVRAFLEKKQEHNRLGALWRCAGWKWEHLPDDGGEIWLMLVTGYDSPEKFISDFDPLKCAEQARRLMGWK